jgi:7-cyano-7-deazaguanine synthase
MSAISNEKVIVVLSGGMDSATLLYHIKDMGAEPLAISFDYNQKHKKELQSARKLITNVACRWMIFDLYDLSLVADKSALVGDEGEIPEGHYAAPNMRQTVVPNRNMTMLSIAAAWAVNEGAIGVATGVHAGDHAIYPDCRTEFIVHMETTLKLANEGFIHPSFQIIAPYIQMGKDGIVQIGTKLGVPYHETWSCYKVGKKHCGKCGTCVERKEAFELAGVEDPTEYADGK